MASITIRNLDDEVKTRLRVRAAGRHVEPVDCQIAAIARSRGLTVATRNVGDFECMEVALVDPCAAV